MNNVEYDKIKIIHFRYTNFVLTIILKGAYIKFINFFILTKLIIFSKSLIYGKSKATNIKVNYHPKIVT